MPALTDLATIAAQRAAGGRPSAVLGGHLGTWFLSFGIAGEGTPAIVLPDEQLAVPTADGGLTVTRVPADPTLPQQVRLHPGRTALNDAEVTVLQAADVAANAIPNAPPPTDSEALTAYLSAAAATAPSNDAVAMTAALEQVLTNWTPGPAESAAIASWLAQQPSLTALGAVTDRLGRPGVAYRMDATNGEGAAATRRTIVLSPFTGAVLSMELSFLDDPGEYDVKPYAVISYEAYDLE